IREVRQQALALLAAAPGAPGAGDVEQVWNGLGEDYFMRHSADEVAWHARTITGIAADRLPLVLVREMTSRGASEIFIYMQDHDNIFSRATHTLDRLGLNIVDARIITSTSGYTLD